MTAEFAIPMSQSLARLITDEPDASEAVFGFRTERRMKATNPNADGTVWDSVPMIVTFDAANRIISETPERGE